MKTLAELNSKIWYRLLKVIFIIIFILFCGYAVVIAFSEVGSYQEDYTVVCNYGNKSTFLAFKDKGIAISTYYDYSKSLADLPSYTKEELQTACAISEEEMNAKMESILNNTVGGNKLFDSMKLFDLTKIKINESTYTSAFAWSILAIFIISVVLEIIKRAFYYIVLGSIKPSKK